MNVLKARDTITYRLLNKYKIHFYLFWILLFAAQTYRYTVNQPLRPVLLGNLAELGSSAVFACTVLFFLLPRFGKNGKRKLFITLTLILLFVAAFTSSYLDYLIVLSVGLSFERANYVPRIPGQLIYISLVSFSFGFVKIADDYFREKTRSEELTKDKLRAELELLKAQINPHFLFNTLNNLYFMVEKDPKRAATMILMLSDILRYQIYETDLDKTSMGKEIENIKNYVELERIRKDNISITFDVLGEPEAREVLPNVLLALVENAFKHLAIRSDGSCSVNISVEDKDGVLSFEVKNSSGSNGIPKPASYGRQNGLGMTNLRKRLELFYPGKHKLEIDTDNENELYEVKLKLYGD